MYKKGLISSKYIGFNHYRRYFTFTDNIPNIDFIFKYYDVILARPMKKTEGMKKQYCQWHICKNYDEILNIIKAIKPEYYKIALKTTQEQNIYLYNIFIMKKNDFFKYCEFIFDVLFEFDKRNNLTSDKDVLDFAKKSYNISSQYYYQSRLQGFLAERISNIFYHKHFKKILTYDTGNYIS